MKKDIFLVDADGTILDFYRSSMRALKIGMKKIGGKWKKEYLTVFKELNDSLWARLERKEITRAELMEMRFPAYLKLLGLPYSGEEYNKEYLWHLREKPYFIKGAKGFLKKLKKHGKIYIVTNGTKEIQKARFAACKMDRYATDVFVSDAIGHDKPSEKYNEYVFSHIPNFDRDRAVWIGDSQTSDVAAANKAKIFSILFAPNGAKETAGVFPDRVVKTWGEIFRILGL